MAKYIVTVGEEFAVDGVEIDNMDAVERLAAIHASRRFSSRQDQIAFGVLGVFLAAIAISALIGWLDGTYDELGTVWSAGGIWAGLVLGRYFKKD